MSNRIAHSKKRTAPFHKIATVHRILVVDDDVALRGLHAAILSLEGYEIETAEDGADALEQLAGRRFDLVVTDREMPVLDGERMVLALRSAGLRLPVVMISGSLPHWPLSRRVAGELSAALPKPPGVAEVLAAVSAALEPCARDLRLAA